MAQLAHVSAWRRSARADRRAVRVRARRRAARGARGFLNRLTLAVFLVRVSTFVLVSFLCVVVARYALLMWFAWLQHVEHMTEPLEAEEHPFVTILVPAYNEGAVIQGSIRSLLELDYPRYEIVVIDDGSKDDTYPRRRPTRATTARAVVRVITKTNGGKARALNTGIAAAHGDFILCMDGDSALHPATLRRAIRHFEDPASARWPAASRS